MKASKSIGARIALLLICVAWMVPILGLLISSFRRPGAVSTSGWWTVFAPPFDFSNFTLSNYQDVLSHGMGRAFVNTLAVAIPATACPILIAAFAAYVFTFMRVPGRSWMFAVFIALMVVPAQTTLVPLLKLFSSLGINGSYASVWIVHSGFGLPLATYILYNFMATIPEEIIESARVDGASHFQIFWRFAFPLSTPAIAAFATFQFLWTWNDFLIAMVFLGGAPDVQTMTMNLQTMIGSMGEAWYLLTAGAFTTMIVPMIVFFALQRFFVRGLTAGSVK